MTKPEPSRKKKPASSSPNLPSLLGVGFDAGDEHSRLTRGPEFLVVGGSSSTHDRLVDRSSAFFDVMKKYGRRMDELSPEEYYAIVDELGESRRNWFFMPRS